MTKPDPSTDGPQTKAGSNGLEVGLQDAGHQIVGGQEQVAAVAVELGPLAGAQRGLNRQRVQAELLAQHGEVVVVGATQAQADRDGAIGQVIADAGDREARAAVRSSCSSRFGRDRRRAASIKCFVTAAGPG